MAPRIYLLRITEAGRVVAEAELIVHDPAAALRTFHETLGQVVQNILPGVITAVQLACGELATPPVTEVVAIDLQGNHTGIEIVPSLPGRNRNGGHR